MRRTVCPRHSDSSDHRHQRYADLEAGEYKYREGWRVLSLREEPIDERFGIKSEHWSFQTILIVGLIHTEETSATLNIIYQIIMSSKKY